MRTSCKIQTCSCVRISSHRFKDNTVWRHTGQQAVWRHTGQKTEVALGTHAMLLIGYRKFKNEYGNEKTHYLLQNWWKDKAYVEVDTDYLAPCESCVRFVRKQQIRMGEFETCDDILVECEVDASEQHALED
jgi:hypothetical protein